MQAFHICNFLLHLLVGPVGHKSNKADNTNVNVNSVKRICEILKIVYMLLSMKQTFSTSSKDRSGRAI